MSDKIIEDVISEYLESYDRDELLDTLKTLVHVHTADNNKESLVDWLVNMFKHSANPINGHWDKMDKPQLINEIVTTWMVPCSILGEWLETLEQH